MEKIIFKLTIVATGILFCFACKRSAAPSSEDIALPVSVDTVKLQPVVYFDEYPGTVVALNEVVVTPQVTGYITGVHFKDGQHVTKGQLLYTLDPQQYQANVLQANANYRVAESNLLVAQQDADRYLFLQQNDAIARQIVDHSLAGLQAAKMQLEAARAAIQNVQTGLKYTTIYAPLSGTIGISRVKPGAAVSPGLTQLNTISSDDPIAADFNIDEKDIAHFEQLAQLPEGQADSLFTIALPNGKLYPFTGRITLLDRAVDPQTATIITRLELRNPVNELKSGMSCVVRVRNAMGHRQLVIPLKAVMEQLGEFYVFVIENNIARRQKIVNGHTIGNELIVKDGLKEGDLIVTEGTGKLKAGMKVTVNGKM